MNEREAQEVIRMVEANWQMDLGTARGIWREELMHYEAEIGTKAVAWLAKRLIHKPKLADLRPVLAMFARNAKGNVRMEIDARAMIEQGKRGVATPEWVWVWSWARRYRDPIVEKGFPQQGDWADPSNVMTRAEYEALRDEWLAAGSPKERPRVLAEV